MKRFLMVLGISCWLLAAGALADPPSYSYSTIRTRLAAPATRHGRVEVRQIIPRVFMLVFPSRRDVAMTFLRFQEHYESPEFRGRIFTLDEYRDWYIRKKGAFTYATDYAGFNIPSYVMDPFYEGRFSNLTKGEHFLLDLFRKYRGTRFYVIAASRELEGQIITGIRHEVSHALFYMDGKYHREVTAVLDSIDARPIHKYLESGGGYHRAVWEDETHAYLTTEPAKLRHRGIDIEPYRDAITSLNEIFERHFRKWSR